MSLGPFFNVYASPEEWEKLKALRKEAGLGSFVIPYGEQVGSSGGPLWEMAVLMNDLLGREMDNEAGREKVKQS